MNKSELISGEYYYAEYCSGFYAIIKCSNSGDFTISSGLSSHELYFLSNNWSCNKNIRLATANEKHWLNECIRLNKFITKQEAMKTFPDAIRIDTEDQLKYVNKKVNKDLNVFILKDYGSIIFYLNTSGFDTIESHSARNVITFDNWLKLNNYTDYGDDFVLPAKWCVKVADEFERKTVMKYLYPRCSNVRVNSRYFTPFGLSGAGHSQYNFWNHEEITFEQFKKYVLKENTSNNIESTDNNKTYTIDSIQKVLLKEYDNSDVEDIIKIIKTIK